MRKNRVAQEVGKNYEVAVSVFGARISTTGAKVNRTSTSRDKGEKIQREENEKEDSGTVSPFAAAGLLADPPGSATAPPSASLPKL